MLSWLTDITGLFNFSLNDLEYQTWKSSFEKALRRIKRANTPMGRTVLQVIEQNDVEVLPFCRMNESFIQGVIDEWKEEDWRELPSSENKSKRERILDCSGWFHPPRTIYVNDKNNLSIIIETLFHEVSHFLNQKDEDTPRGLFVSEYRAFYTELLAKDKPITRQACYNLKREVRELYNIDLPDEKIDAVPNIPNGDYYEAMKPAVKKRRYK